MEKKQAVVHASALPKQYTAELLVFDHGEGVYLFDVAGRRYLDFGAGIAVNALGYGREDLAEIAAAQMRKLVHTSNLFTTEPTLALAAMLKETGPFQAVHLGNSGTEANEAALKYARLYSFKRKGKGHAKLLCFDSAFHGRSMGALSVTPNEHYQEPYRPLLSDVVVAPFNDAGTVERLLDPSFAGVIVEVIQGEGGLRVMTEEFASALNRLCRKHDVILIADEVQTGLGRTGYRYASEWIGLEPDIITLAKPLGGGLPLSATLIPEKINSLLSVGDHGTTFGGGPVQAALSRKILETVLAPEFLKHVRATAARLDEGLESLARGHSLVTELRGAGMLRGLVIAPARGDVAGLIAKARENGLLLLRSGSNVLRIAPPLVVTSEEVDEGISILDRVLP